MLRTMSTAVRAVLVLFTATAVLAQSSTDPFPAPIPATEGVILVGLAEFASLPDIDGVAARMMQLQDEPGTKRLFVNDQRGPLYTVSYDGAEVALYLDVNDPKWGVGVLSMGRERGVQHFAFHPQFGQPGTPGAGKFYMFVDTPNQSVPPDFRTPSEMSTHDNVVLEWTATTPGAPTYDGGRPKELFRFRDPFANHNGGFMAFNPLAREGAPDFGMLYIGIADGGSGGDPMNLSQNMASAFGKILRIDPLGTNSRNRRYGIPPDNPFIAQPGALPEIWAVGVRNPQRAAWDPRNGNLFISDIGQNIVEEVSIVTRGANLGWNLWEGSYRFVSRDAVSLEAPRSDPTMTYPVVEWGQLDPLLQTQSAAGGLVVYRASDIPQIANMVLFADMPSGEMFYVSADKLPSGGQGGVHRVLFNDNGTARTLLQIIQEKNKVKGQPLATRADLRISLGRDNRVYLLNKGDGAIRVLTK
jgi:hypothetical protein